MKVGVLDAACAFHGVGDPGGFEVGPQHHRASVVPCPRSPPDGAASGLVGQVITQGGRYVRGQRLQPAFAALVVLGGKGDGSGGEVEARRRQTGQRRRPKAGRTCHEIKEVAVFPAQAPEYASALTGRIEQLAKLVGGQFAADSSTVHVRIQQLQGRQRIRSDTTGLDHPIEESTKGADVMIDRFWGCPLRLLFDQGFDR